MKILLSLVLIFMGMSVQGQFLKKLGKKAQQAAERTVERRVEKEASKKTDQTIDSVFEKGERREEDSPEVQNQEYDFESYYVMQLVQDKDTLLMTSYFGKDRNVLGSSMEMRPGEKILTVIDLNTKRIHSFMDLRGQKTKTSMRFSPEDIDDTADMSAVKVSETGEVKEILGYPCKGYRVEGKEYQGIVWVTSKTDIRYPKGFAELQIKNAKHSGVDHKWMTMIDGLALEMDLTVTSKRKPEQVLMTCVELGKADFKVNSDRYKSAF